MGKSLYINIWLTREDICDFVFLEIFIIIRPKSGLNPNKKQRRHNYPNIRKTPTFANPRYSSTRKGTKLKIDWVLCSHKYTYNNRKSGRKKGDMCDKRVYWGKKGLCPDHTNQQQKKKKFKYSRRYASIEKT